MSPRPPPSSPRSGGRSRAPAEDDPREPPPYQTGHDYPAADEDAVEPQGGWEAPPAAYVPGSEQDRKARVPTKVKSPAAEEPLPNRERVKLRSGRPAAPQPPPPQDEEEENPDVTRAGPPLTLEVVAGKSKGRKKRFLGVRMVIGRSPECEFHIPDPSVSRRHLELVQGEGGVLMRDLGSGNGTKVNGELVSEHVLQHGDQIDVGQTSLRFVDEVAAVRLAREAEERRLEEEAQAEEEEARRQEEEAQAAEEARQQAIEAEKQRAQEEFNRTLTGRVMTMSTRVGDAYRATAMRTRLVVAGGLVLAVLLFFVSRALMNSGPPPPDPRMAAAMDKLAAADRARAEGRLDHAIVLYSEAERIYPGVDADGRGRQAREEREARAIIADARALLQKGQPFEARQALAGVPDVGPAVAEEAKQALREIEGAEQQEKAAAVEHALAAGDLEGARLALGAVGESRRAPYLERIEALEAVEREAAAQSRERQAAQGAAAAKQARAARLIAMNRAFDNVARKLHGGEFSRAAQECDRVIEANPGDPQIRARAISLQRTIPVFATNYEDGLLKLRSGASAAAARPLRKARELLLQMGLPGPLSVQLDSLLAQTASAAGKQALNRNDLATAFSAFNEALRLNGGDADAREGLEQVRSRAQQVYLEGYQVRDRDPSTALKKFRLVKQIAPPGSELAEKVNTELVKLEP